MFFGISAVAGYVVPSRGSMIDLAAANWNTALGALCFLACAVATLRSGRTAKAPRVRRLRGLEAAAAARRRAGPLTCGAAAGSSPGPAIGP